MSIQEIGSKRDWHRGTPMLEQLWYTWSTVGLGPLSAGFRIRAASPGLSDVRSPRVQALDRYLRYVLPAGTDPFAITPDMAPVCLSLLQTEQGEWLLVNKTYKGKDDVGRPGAFFVHLLCNFPPEFSAAQAISLWRSPFLQSSDVNQSDGKPLSGVRLDLIPFDDLRRWPSSNFDFRYPRGISSSWLYDCFPLVLRAYLMWRRRWEQWMQQQPQGIAPQTEPPRIYVAAPSDMVAAFISGITRCLPPQLTSGLTFSTYEYDARSKGQVLFIGTSWASSADGQSANQDLPAACYQEGVAINCYTYDESRTQLANDALAISFAEYATECLINDNFQELDWLFTEKTAHKLNLNVSAFLQTYESYIVKAQNPTQQDVELYLADADADMLVKVHVQDLITNLAMSDASWLNNVLKRRLTSFLRQTGTMPKLGNALDQLAKTSSQKAAQAIDAGDIRAFNAMLGVVQQIAPGSSEVWRIQPRIFARPTIQFFLTKHPEALFQFIEYWSRLNPLPGIDEVRPFLNVPAQHFEKFYSLNLPPEWKYIATEALINSAIAQNAVPVLGQKYPRAVTDLMQYLVKNAWPKARTLFMQLAERDYPDKLFLLTLLLDPSMALAEDEIEALLKKTLSTNEERESFLIQYGPSYLLSSLRETVVLNLLRTFAMKVPNRKMPVLESWFKSESLARWLEASSNGPGNLDKILQATAPLAPHESNSFLETYGKHYLERYLQQSPAYQPSSIIVDYIKRYVASLDPKRLRQPLPATREFLSLLYAPPLWKYLSIYLSKREQQTVQQWLSFLKFLQRPSIRIDAIKDLGSNLLQLRLDGDLPVIERLAQVFASRISSATELVSVSYSMSSFIKEPELLQMLYTMAEYLRDYMADRDDVKRHSAEVLIEPYVEFALCFDSAYALKMEGEQPAMKEKLFLQTFLYILLQNASQQIIDSLNTRARESNLAYWKKWIEVKPLQSSSPNGEFLGSLSVNRQPSRLPQSPGQANNPLEAFLAQPSTGRKEVEALLDQLPDLKGVPILMQELAKAFASCVESETELTSVIMILGRHIPKPYLLQMLYVMAEYIRDNISRPESTQRAEALLEPYIKFVLCFESVFESPDDEERKVFMRTFLNLLLQFADESTFQQFNNRNWPDNLIKKWQEFRPRHFAGTRF